jgi:hypothetical protein
MVAVVKAIVVVVNRWMDGDGSGCCGSGGEGGEGHRG